MQRLLCEFLHEEKGATAIEYGLIAALMALAIIGGIGRFADALEWLWGNNNSRLVQVLTQ